MKRWLSMVIVISVFALLPSQGVELGMMRPAEALQIRSKENGVIVATDLGDKGVGDTLDEAIDNLVESSTGKVYLDTVQFLILDKASQAMTDEIKTFLRPSVNVCSTEESADLERVCAYLRAHRLNMKLEDIRGNTKLPLMERNGEEYVLANEKDTV